MRRLFLLWNWIHYFHRRGGLGVSHVRLQIKEKGLGLKATALIAMGLVVLWGCCGVGGATDLPPESSFHGEEAFARSGAPLISPDAMADLHKTLQRLDEQNSKLTRDLRRIQREIAALRADLDAPGLQEIFSGIGYILGLFGVAAFMAARNKENALNSANHTSQGRDTQNNNNIADV